MIVKPGTIARIDRAAAARTRTAWATLLQDAGGVRDVIGGQNLPAVGTRIITPDGEGLSFNGTQVASAQMLGLPPLENLAFIARVRANSATQLGNPGAAFGMYAPTGNQYGAGIGFNGATVGVAWLTTNGAGLAAPVPIVVGQWYTVIVQSFPESALPTSRTWVQGVGSATAASAGGYSSPATALVLGGQTRDGGPLRQGKFDIAWAAILAGDSALWMTDEIANDLFASGYPYNMIVRPRTLWPVSSEPPALEPIAPPLLTNSQSPHAPSVGRGAVPLSPPLLSSVGVLYAALVGRGAVAVAPPMLANATTLYAPAVKSVSAALRPPLLSNTNAVHALAVGRGAIAIGMPLLASSGQMFAPAVGAGGSAVAMPLLVNGSVVHAPSVQPGAVALSAPLLLSGGAVYAPSVSAGAVQLLPPLLADTQIFYAPSVASVGASIRPSLLISASELYAPAVTVGDVTLAPPLLVGTQIFYPAIVGQQQTEEAYPLAGKAQIYPLTGQQQTYPLAGVTQE